MKASETKVESGIATRQRLLESAQQLFAEQGFDRVSVRDITDRAGANVAAVNYHFRSREGLVEEVIERYINPINDERLERLEKLERRFGSKPAPLEEILDAFIRPFVTQVRRSEMSEMLFYRLMGRIFGDLGGALPASVEAGLRELLQRFGKAFSRSLPGVDREELTWRIHFMVGAMIHTMAHGETLRRLSGDASGDPSMETTLSRFIRFSAAGLRDGVCQDEKGGADGPQNEFLF
ncbi:TetR/AcrR family transcriptional regulator [Haloferula rosea]|uniref:TetR family transcriptional regulator n=1 Tax=Haloferula rosea TaxID=490093 RepID=A0A934R8I5_9BACT|nr:TetR/AcrR family transcriptional regulator [Haloferula rosea]MBK1826252.1 TetR family transcriptional regulator [Haloferula rosea]